MNFLNLNSRIGGAVLAYRRGAAIPRVVVETHTLDGGTAIADVDVGRAGEIAVVSGRPIQRSHAAVGVPGVEWTEYRDCDLRFIPGQTTPLDFPCNRPMVRALPTGRALIHDSSTPDGLNNTWIIDRNGRKTAAFDAGICVEEIVVCGPRVAVTYFDEGIFSRTTLAPQGVTVFDSGGQFEFGYHSALPSAPRIWDCYAAAADERGRLIIVPYAADSLIVRLDLESKEHEAFAAPPGVRGAQAVSANGKRVFLWNPRENPGMIVETHFGNDSARVVGGPFEGRLRGLPGGRFIRRTPAGYDMLAIAD